jgi:putative SOS response-associated peptidase YedK
MCYQTRLIKKREEILERFNVAIDELNDYEPIEYCSAFDFPKTPVITSNEPKKAQLFHWGLIPEWSQDNSIRKYTLNARIETLNEKRSFKDVIQNRCLIIADGFYEWQWLTKNGSKKQKYLITLPQASLFSFAGIHSEWTNFEGDTINSYSIITTQANELMSQIHNTKQRMPVILEKSDEQLWLKGEDYKKFAYPYRCDLLASPINQQNLNQLDLF